MNIPLRYAATGAAGIALVTAALWPFLDPAGRQGVLMAGAVALSVQAVAFALLLHYRRRMTAFMAVWAGGTLVRMGVVVAVAAVLIRLQTDGAVPMLLALVAFLFGLLLLEPKFMKLDHAEGLEA